MDRLTALRLFLCAVERRGISGAGRALGLSSTAASKGLQDLEAELGVRLLNRTTRHLAPTEAGEALYRRLAPLLGELDGALRETRELQDRPRGMLRVLARRSFALLHVVPSLRGFREAFPEVSLDLALTELPDIAPANGVDLVIRHGLPAEKSLVGHPLASARRILCASPAYLARRPPPRRPQDVLAHDCLGYRREAEPVVWIFDAPQGRQVLEVVGPLRSNSGEALRQAALDGLGLVLLPEWMVGADLAAGRLVACLPEIAAHPAGFDAPIYAIHARAEPVPAKVTAFVAHLRARLGPG
ncbi:LysR family transcriptional regulator [Roseomonas sp. E05]|uniref:LysR family transcriptional regulator n=1 Tax=Roseomonas sp. E05 TaxID=3046310 RepID=UPI0024BADFE0|nr:LysR family transcriptional regulator [Roseomonas sp. E05]MDJ0389072.1 LysR family transcriptional regulator [Roseomonas sp. E05]